MMHPRRTGNIDKIRGLAVEHQLQVVVHADVLDEPDGLMAALGNRIVNDAESDAIARQPSRQMRPCGDLAESRDSTPQFSAICHDAAKFQLKQTQPQHGTAVERRHPRCGLFSNLPHPAMATLLLSLPASAQTR